MYSTKAVLLFGIIKSGVKVKSYVKLPSEIQRRRVIKNIYKLNYAAFSTDFSIEPEKNNTDEISLTPLSPEMEEIANGDPEIGKKIRMILMEYEMEKLTNNRVPSVITPSQMKDLLELRGFMARRKKLGFYFLKELLPKIDKEKKEMKRIKRLEELKLQGENDHIQYGLNKNTIFLYIRDTSISRYYTLRQSYALMFGQPLVFDLGFKNQMNQRELTNLIDQLQLAYSLNKINQEPFNLHFTNVDSTSYDKLKLAMPQIEDTTNMITITDKSYTDLFPKKQLLYLSPDAPNALKNYDPNTVYIIGGIVDLGSENKITMSKAKREGIAMAKLPLEDHVIWGTGASKCLTLNQIMKIMLMVKSTQDWKEALLSGVPRRKLKSIDKMREEQFEKQNQQKEALYRRKNQFENRGRRFADKKFWKELI